VSSATRVFYDSVGKVAIYEDDATATDFKASANSTMASYYTRIGEQFNADIEPIIRNNFGDMRRRDATTDKNGVVILLFTPRIAQAGSNALGVTSTCDLKPRDDKKSHAVGGPYTGTNTNGSSNYGEIAYITLPTVVGSGYGGNTADEWYRSIRSTIVHEGKHLAAYAERAFKSYPVESEWLEEGTARLAEELWMRIAVDKVGWKSGTGFGNVTPPVNVFCDLQTTAPCASGLRPAKIMSRHFGTMLTALKNPGQYSVFGGPGAVPYAEAWSRVRYAVDRYASTEKAFVESLTVAPDTGVRNLELRSGGVTIGQLLGGRALSMYADHYPGLASANADIAFPTWDLRNIYTWFNGSSASPTALPYPLVPTPLTFGSVTSTPVVALLGGSSTWYELSGTQMAPQLLRLEGSGGAALPSTLRLAIARLQ